MWCCRSKESAIDIATKGLEKQLAGNGEALKSADDRKVGLYSWQNLASRLTKLFAAVLTIGTALLAYKFGLRQVLFHRKVQFAAACILIAMVCPPTQCQQLGNYLIVLQGILMVLSFILGWRINKLTEKCVQLRESRHELLHRCANELPLKAARELLARYAPDGGDAYLSINRNMEKQMTDLREGCRELLRIVDHLVCLRGAEVSRADLESDLGPVAGLVKKYSQHLSPAAKELLTAGMGERILGLMGATPTAARAGSATPRQGGHSQRELRTPRTGAPTPRMVPNSTFLQTIHDDDAGEAATPGGEEEPLPSAQPPSTGRVRRRLHTDDDAGLESTIASTHTQEANADEPTPAPDGTSETDGATQDQAHTKAE